MRISDWSSDVCSSDLDLLESAGVADADMLIAVTYADEVNMVACQVAHSLFNVPTKIARIRQQSYLDPRSEEHTSELQSLMRISYAVFCLKKKIKHSNQYTQQQPSRTDER